jgi:hypothetical protein
VIQVHHRVGNGAVSYGPFVAMLVGFLWLMAAMVAAVLLAALYVLMALVAIFGGTYLTVVRRDSGDPRGLRDYVRGLWRGLRARVRSELGA